MTLTARWEVTHPVRLKNNYGFVPSWLGIKPNRIFCF
jgi:hypothetical protein